MSKKRNRTIGLHSIAGITLIELMLSLFIGCMLVGLLGKIYFNWMQQYRLLSSLNDLQMNAHKALAILDNELGKAGHIGCARLTATFPIINDSIYTLTAANSIVVKNNGLTVRYAEDSKVTLLKQHPKSLKLSTEMIFKIGDVLLISDCKQAEVIRVVNVFNHGNMQEIVTAFPLHFSYENHAEVSRLVMNTFFVGKTNRLNNQNKSIFSLFKKDIKQRRTELVEGINSISFNFSIKKLNKIIELSANEIDDWSQVVGVKADLLCSINDLQQRIHFYKALRLRLNE